MEEFTSDIHKELKPATFLELNQNMELLNSFSEINQPLNSHVLDYFSSDNFLNNNDANISLHHFTSNIPIQLLNLPENSFIHHAFSSTCDKTEATGVTSSQVLINNDDCHKFNAIGGRKRKRKGGEVTEKPKDVIHVRAKRGQATDSHSLAERVRREKINEKLKLLQDLVPGCYKTMGMAVMLDVIINYVRSLQNQIEFLSMKLSAASMFYDFNSPEAEALETLQRTTNPCDAHEMEKMAREGYGGTVPRSHSSWLL